MQAKVRSSFPAAAVLAVALLVSACLPAATPEPAAAPGAWEVDFGISGGIAGLMNQMTISGDGRLVAENIKRRTRVEQRLSPIQLQELHRLIGQAQSAPPAPRSSPEALRRCADCMQYRLTVSGAGGGDRGRPAISESGTLEGPQTGNRELVAFLTAILNESLRP